MVGTKHTHSEDMSYIRKIRKPLVEKKRRERMNQSISQLKSLITQTIKQTTPPMTRVDKADILELTVYHLTQLQQQQRSVTMATEAAAFSAGYKACASEAVTYLANTKTSSTVTGSLSNHLHSSFLMHSRRQQTATHLQNYPRGATSQRNIDRLSTPLRSYDSLNTSLPELNLSGYSPILNNTQYLPELTSSFVHAGLNSSSSSDYSSTNSSVSISSSESCMSYSDNSTGDDYRAENEAKELESINVVTIGNGEENKIGHVIKEVPWRPF